MELYAERGYEQTTVAEIAQRAGLTARTFFRYFADKREVLFAGSEALGEQLDAALAAAPASATPLAAVAAALGVVAETIGEDRDFSRRRQAVISANAELQERELIKLAGVVGRARRRAGAPRRRRADREPRRPHRRRRLPRGVRAVAGRPRRPVPRGHPARLVRPARRRHRRGLTPIG